MGRSKRRGLAWSVLEHFYRGRHAFVRIHQTYEGRVKKLVQERGKTREELRLNPDETRDLFDTWALEQLLSGELSALRASSRAYFADEEYIEPFASKVSRIYHELAILREEHLSVRSFPRDGGGREFSRLFREVSKYYPQRLRRVRDLFARAQRRLEELLPELVEDTIVVRSAYLFRAELWPDNPQAGLVRFIEKMFPDDGAAKGFLTVARSFFRAGFFETAAGCARMGSKVAAKKAQARSSHAKQIRDTISDLDKLAARADAEHQALLHVE